MGLDSIDSGFKGKDTLGVFDPLAQPSLGAIVVDNALSPSGDASPNFSPLGQELSQDETTEGTQEGLHNPMPTETSRPDALETFARSFFHSGIEAPINGATQLINELAGQELLGQLEIVGEPEPAQEGSLEKTAQLVGSALGMLIPYILIYKAVGKLGQISNSLPLYENAIVRNAATGAIMGGALSPLSKTEESDWLTARLKNATVQAGTFAILSGVSQKMGSFSQQLAPKMAASPALANVGNRIINVGTNVAAAIPAGAAGAQFESISKLGRPATWNETKDTAIEYATVAGVLGGIHSINPFTLGPEATVPNAASEPMPGFQKYRPRTVLDFAREATPAGSHPRDPKVTDAQN